MSSDGTKLDIGLVIEAANSGASTQSGEAQSPESTKVKLLDVERTWYVSTTEEELDNVMFRLVQELGFALEDAMEFKKVERNVWRRYKIGVRNSSKYVCPISVSDFMAEAENLTLQLDGQTLIAKPIDFQPVDIEKRRNGWDDKMPYSYGWNICDPNNERWGHPVKVTLPNGMELDARLNGSITLKGSGNARLTQPLKDGVSTPEDKKSVLETLDSTKE